MCLPLRVHVHSLQAAEASTAGAKVLRDGAINSGGGKYLTEIDAGRWHQGLKGFEHTSTLPSVVAAVIQEPHELRSAGTVDVCPKLETHVHALLAAVFRKYHLHHQTSFHSVLACSFPCSSVQILHGSSIPQGARLRAADRLAPRRAILYV